MPNEVLDRDFLTWKENKYIGGGPIRDSKEDVSPARMRMAQIAESTKYLESYNPDVVRVPSFQIDDELLEKERKRQLTIGELGQLYGQERHMLKQMILS